MPLAGQLGAVIAERSCAIIAELETRSLVVFSDRRGECRGTPVKAVEETVGERRSLMLYLSCQDALLTQ
jgi:hypothetical protein